MNVFHIDSNKAFNKVLKSKLLLKIENLGLVGPLLKLIKDFLGRRRKTKISRKCYFWKPVFSGVMQGFVLSLLKGSTVCK